MEISLLQALRQNSSLVGTLLTIPSPQAAEALSLCGLDWLFIDLEHSPMEARDAQALIQAIANRCYSVIRLPDHSPSHFKKIFDTGCDGIIVPLVNDAKAAQQAVTFSKYPPLGERSVGLGRAQGYGLKFAEYIKTANANIAVIIQIEHRDAVANLDAILEVKGIDAIFIGPYDLSGSMGLLGEVSHPEVMKAISTIKSKCLKKEMPWGIFCSTVELAQPEVKTGGQLIAVGTDLLHLGNAAKTVVSAFKVSSKP